MKNLSKMFDITNKRVNTLHVNSSTCYDKKIKNEKLQVEPLVYTYLLRNEKKLLSGMARTKLEKHPVHEIQINGK